mgnify:CR=1 FL=1
MVPSQPSWFSGGAGTGGISGQNRRRGPEPTAMSPADDGRRGRIVLVWGPHGSPGRSTVSASLAHGLAASGGAILVDADVEAPAPQPVARVVARDGRIVDDGPMDLEALLAHSGASESQIEELVAVGLISPDVRGRYSQQNLRTVRLAMEITRKGVPLRNLRAVRASAEREADTIDQAVAPRRSRSRSAGEETARELAELVADLHTILLRRAVDALG